jgi:hypothetical protein
MCAFFLSSLSFVFCLCHLCVQLTDVWLPYLAGLGVAPFGESASTRRFPFLPSSLRTSLPLPPAMANLARPLQPSAMAATSASPVRRSESDPGRLTVLAPLLSRKALSFLFLFSSTFLQTLPSAIHGSTTSVPLLESVSNSCAFTRVDERGKIRS